ncbi:hypothetical protein QOZ80_1AG0008120 [Eleusine coracana subsp. coracana]|nr:hypothetical protein QOZ80_1AG0008120 [Eleusine coracana subsp. coracana]
MEKRVASVLLVVLSVAGFSAAAAAGSGDTDTIRLPSDGRNGNNDERPWECCNLPRCTRNEPPSCQCLDRVKKCPDACRECVSVEAGLEACVDWHHGDPGPQCGRKGGMQRAVDDAFRRDHEASKEDDNKERPPWKCCDRAVPGPSTTLTPVWYCMDKFEHCECEHCQEHFCLDGYKGRDPGPSCSHDG